MVRPRFAAAHLACFVTATQLRLRKYWYLPAQLWHLRTLRRQLREGDGLVAAGPDVSWSCLAEELPVS